MRYLSAFGIGSALAFFASPAAAQLVANGGFASGSLEPWVFTADPGSEPNMVATIAEFQGSPMFRLNPGHDGTGGWKGGMLEQRVELEPDRLYVVSGKLFIQNLRTGTNTNGGRIRVMLGEHIVHSVEVGPVTGLQIIDKSFSTQYRTERGGETVLRITFSRPWRNSNPVSIYHWADELSIARPACYANCDGSSVEPVLNVDDFVCFINAFGTAQALPPEEQVGQKANCDKSTSVPVLNVDDFTCFINAYALGCP